MPDGFLSSVFSSPGRCLKPCSLSQPLVLTSAVWSGSSLSGRGCQEPGRCCRVGGTWRTRQDKSVTPLRPPWQHYRRVTAGHCVQRRHGVLICWQRCQTRHENNSRYHVLTKLHVLSLKYKQSLFRAEGSKKSLPL